MNTETFLFTKAVDKSTLEEGFTIPVEVMPQLFESMKTIISHGDKIPINILIDNSVFEIHLNNIDFNEAAYPTHKDMLQFRYTTRPIKSRLRSIFNATYEKVVDHKKRYGGFKKHRLVISESEKEYIDVYYCSEGYFHFVCKPLSKGE